MKAGQTVTLTENDTSGPATVVAVYGDVPGPRVLDLQLGDELVKGVQHASVAGEGEPHWSER